jgi:hypothetical protein
MSICKNNNFVISLFSELVRLILNFQLNNIVPEVNNFRFLPPIFIDYLIEFSIK